MTKLQIALESNTTWVVAATIIVAVLHAIVPFLSGWGLSAVQDLLIVIALFTAPADIQNAGRLGKLGKLY